MSSPAPPDPARCPLCGDANVCGREAGSATCWCFDLEIAPETLAHVPAEAQGVACLCRRCATEVEPASPPPRRAP